MLCYNHKLYFISYIFIGNISYNLFEIELNRYKMKSEYNILKSIHPFENILYFIKKYFIKETRNEKELSMILSLIKKYEVISVCKKRAEYFANVSSDSLNIFKNSDIKKNLQELSFYLINRTN